MSLDGSFFSSVGFWLGYCLVFLGNIGKFDEVLVAGAPDDLKLFKNSQLIDFRRMLMAGVVYFGMFFVLYVILLICGQRLVSSGVLSSEYANMGTPETLGAILGGLLGTAFPNVRYLNEFEKFFRRSAFWVADFPGAQDRVYSLMDASNVVTAQALSERVFGKIPENKINEIKEKIGEAAVVQLMKVARIQMSLVNGRFPFDRLSPQIQGRFSAAIYAMGKRIEDVQTELKLISDSNGADRKATGIQESVRSLYTAALYVCACAVAAQSQASRRLTAQSLRSIGFEVDLPPDPSDRVVFSSLFISCLAVFVLDYVVRFLITTGDITIPLLGNGCNYNYTIGGVLALPGLYVNPVGMFITMLGLYLPALASCIAFIIRRRAYIESEKLIWRDVDTKRIRLFSLLNAFLTGLVVGFFAIYVFQAFAVLGMRPDLLFTHWEQVTQTLKPQAIFPGLVFPMITVFLVWRALERLEFSKVPVELKSVGLFLLLALILSLVVAFFAYQNTLQTFIVSTKNEVRHLDMSTERCAVYPFALHQFAMSFLVFFMIALLSIWNRKAD